MSQYQRLTAYIAVVLFFGIASPGVANARQPIYVSSAFPHAAEPYSGDCSDCDWGQIGQHAADQFQIASNATLSGVDFAIYANYGHDWNIEINIFDSAGHSLYSHVNAPSSYGLTNVGNSIAIVHADIAGVTLDPGSYYIGWYDPAGLGIPNYHYGTTMIAYYGSHLFGGNATIPNGLGTAFQISADQTNAVPEPASLVLLLTGLALLRSLRRSPSKSTLAA